MTREISRDEILAMPAGRELDALVAEKVMGWSWGIIGDLIPPYSTDISAAWEVVEKMKQEYEVSIWTDKNGKWACEIGYLVEDDCETAPLAISRAALLATMEETP